MILCDCSVFYSIVLFYFILLFIFLLGEDTSIETKTTSSLFFHVFFLWYIFHLYRISYLNFLLKPILKYLGAIHSCMLKLWFKGNFIKSVGCEFLKFCENASSLEINLFLKQFGYTVIRKKVLL